MQRGFILIYVLLLLAVLSLTAVFVLERSISEQKMSLGLLQTYQHDAELMAGLQEAYHVIADNVAHSICYAGEPYSPSPVRQGEPFWQTQPSCHGFLHEQAYDYVIEQFSDQACAVYYRVTSHLPSVNQQAIEAIIMVSKLAELNNHESDCFIDQANNLKLYQQLQVPQIVSWHRVE